MILPFNLDGLRWYSGRASRDVLLQLGYIEGIIDLLEPTLEVKSIYRPSYAFYYPKWSHIPRSKLFGGGFLRTVALLLLPDASEACDACQSSESDSPVLFLSVP